MTPALPTRLRAAVCVAATDAARDAAIEEWLQATRASAGRRAILAEGLLFDRTGPHGVPLVGLGAGCACCTGLVVLRVALGRTLRSTRPEAVLLLLASATHLARLRRLLQDGELGVRFEIES